MVSLTVTSSSDKELISGAKRLSDSMLNLLRGEYSSLPFTVFGPFEAQVYKLNEVN